MSLPNTASCSSKPPSSSSTERRTSMPAVLTASTVRTSSCWPWSYSLRSRPGLPAAGAGDRHAHLEQAAQRGPLAQLGAEHVGLGVGLGRGQQLGQRVGCRVGVVVQDPDPLGLLDPLQPQAYGGREGRRRRSAHDGFGAEGRLEQVGRGVLAAGVDGDDASRPCALALEAGDHRGQPRAAVRARAQAYGGRERRRRRRAHDGVGAEGRLEQVGRGVLAAGVDGDEALRARTLALEAGDHRGQPPGAVMADDERDDALSRGRIHGGSR